MMSGFMNAPWAHHGAALQSTLKLLQLANCSSAGGDTVDETTVKSDQMACLEKVYALDLLAKFKEWHPWNMAPVRFAPRIDKEAQEPFLPDFPTKLMENGRFNKVPILLGIAKDEGIDLVSGIVHGFSILLTYWPPNNVNARNICTLSSY
jgi:hypothetical protein